MFHFINPISRSKFLNFWEKVYIHPITMIFALYLLSVNFISDLFLSFSRVLFPTLNFYKYLIYALSRINLPICIFLWMKNGVMRLKMRLKMIISLGLWSKEPYLNSQQNQQNHVSGVINAIRRKQIFANIYTNLVILFELELFDWF